MQAQEAANAYRSPSVSVTNSSVIAEDVALSYPRDPSPHFKLRIPDHWLSPVGTNPYAEEAEVKVLEWFETLGCKPTELARAAKFDAAGYVGIPFPHLSPELTLRIGKYLSLWLLWDDVHVESLEERWKIAADNITNNHKPTAMTRFDEGWWQLFREFYQRRSPQWVEALCKEMVIWNDAAIHEAHLIQAHRDTGTLPGFAQQLELRIATIGMYATVYLLEDEYDYELPQTFHQYPAVKELKKVSNEIVGLGNDIFSFGKDLAEGQINLITTLMHERLLSCRESLATVVRMHDQALSTYDRLATDISRVWSTETDGVADRWLEDVRYASLGFSLWEAKAPRYTTHKVVVDNMVIEPSFHIVRTGASTTNGQQEEKQQS